MNYLLILKLMGVVLKTEALLMLLPIAVAALYSSGDGIYFIYTAIPLYIIGSCLTKIRPKKSNFRSREGFITVSLSWIVLSLFGALPFYLSGYFPSFIDCFFETVSGFTTTGSTILTNVEAVSLGLLFWRSFSHWVGGMGVLVFVLAMMPNINGSTVQLLRAESPGPTPGKFVPKIKETAKILYKIYFFMTAVQVVLLLICGLPMYDSLITAMGSAGTGGFSNMNLSIGAYNNVPAEIITTVFMLLFGVNFNIYYYILNKQFGLVKGNEEFKLYIGIVIASMLLIALNIMPLYSGSFLSALRYSSFQVSTIITTTGYSTADFNIWPTFSKMILMILMVVGASAGSTGGGIKVSRLLILIKAIRREIGIIIHPRRIQTVRMEGPTLEDSILVNVLVFLLAYALIAFISVILISIDGYDFETTITAVLATIGNIGPGFSLVGPMGNFSMFSPFSKLVLSFCMLAGRLEIFPMLVLFSPRVWSRKTL
ncbi:Trk system potassium uptake protein TrkH [Clostridiales bacterium]|nr:Trk system potassium uptake protein TrkH [Clostridiales bacterium]